MEKFQIGVVGMAVMGQNLARNIANNGFKTLIYNRTFETTKNVIEKYGSEYLNGAENLKDFIDQLESPRKIVLMVKAGNPVDEMIKKLIPLLSEDDLIIDCGNSFYKDTEKRIEYLREYGIKYMGTGVSGGEKGALEGPSIMPGGDVQDWGKIRNIMSEIAAKDFEGKPCVDYIGNGGAGHFVKMVHNGIEYGIMQMIAESYEILSKLYKLSPDRIGNIFDNYNNGILNSYLIEITGKVLKQKDDLSEDFIVDRILDVAGSKGTGMWTSVEGLEKGINLCTITQSVFSRYNSNNKNLRVKISEKIKLKIGTNNLPELDIFLNYLENALYLGIISSYAQGLHLIKFTSTQNSRNVNLGNICRIWQGGCIIRSKLLIFLKDSIDKNPNIEHIFESEYIQNTINEKFNDYQKIIEICTINGIFIPTLYNSIGYIDNISQSRTNANLIQGLRDFFGAHTYKRIDKEGTFHTQRDND